MATALILTSFLADFRKFAVRPHQRACLLQSSQVVLSCLHTTSHLPSAGRKVTGSQGASSRPGEGTEQQRGAGSDPRALRSPPPAQWRGWWPPLGALGAECVHPAPALLPAGCSGHPASPSAFCEGPHLMLTPPPRAARAARGRRALLLGPEVTQMGNPGHWHFCANLWICGHLWILLFVSELIKNRLKTCRSWRGLHTPAMPPCLLKTEGAPEVQIWQVGISGNKLQGVTVARHLA